MLSYDLVVTFIKEPDDMCDIGYCTMDAYLVPYDDAQRILHSQGISGSHPHWMGQPRDKHGNRIDLVALLKEAFEAGANLENFYAFASGNDSMPYDNFDEWFEQKDI